MFEIRAKEKAVQRALLVGAYIKAELKGGAESLLQELAKLAETLGIPSVSRDLIS